MNYCPRCGTELVMTWEGGRERPSCPRDGCGYFYFGDHSIGCAGVVIRDGKALLIQRGIEPNRGAWQIPGGYVESDEEIAKAVEREVFEEAGIVAKVADVIGFRHAPGERLGRPDNIYVVFRLIPVEGEPQHDGDETLDAGFFSLDEIKQMEKVQTLSRWAIEQALQTPIKGGLTPHENPTVTLRPGWSIFGAGQANGQLL